MQANANSNANANANSNANANANAKANAKDSAIPLLDEPELRISIESQSQIWAGAPAFLFGWI